MRRKNPTPLKIVQHQLGEQFPSGYVAFAKDSETGEPVFLCELPDGMTALALAALAKQFFDYMERRNREGMDEFFGENEEGEE